MIHTPNSQRTNLDLNGEFGMRPLPFRGKSFQITLNPKIYEQLERQCIKERITMEELVARMVEAELQRRGVL